ncbi:heavy metal translocating P-type ATPase [Candidatus Azambacteria bacterium]|nr:heavy metal translocating P-type ATPase [Candidatus Azambacteria bacterium]
MTQQTAHNTSASLSAGKHAGHTTRMFARKFWVSLALTIPVVLYSGVLERLFRFIAPAFPGSPYIPFILGSLIFFYGGWVFVVGAQRELAIRLPGMMTLIGLAITVAYLWSVMVTIFGKGEPLFWELTTLITVMLLGHWMEMKAVTGASGALQELSKLLPDVAEVIRGGTSAQVPLSELRVGDIVFVRPGGKIPADGVVTEGASDVNESMVTGESKPVPKTVSSEVIAGTINGDGALKVNVTKIGEETFLAGVMRLVEEAQASKSRLQMLSDRAAYYLTIIAIVTGGITLLAWLLSKATPSFALERFVAVVVIACPHALGLAVPLVAAISTTLAARHGFLVKQRLALEAARNIDVVLFDKTGTLTKGEYGVERIFNFFRFAESRNAGQFPISNDNEILRLAASVDSRSEHFIARAIVREAERKGLELARVEDFQRIPGKGVRGKIYSNILKNVGISDKEEIEIAVGGESLAIESRVSIPGEIQTKIDALSRQGKTVIYVIADGQLLGAIALADLMREESREAIHALKTMGVQIAMITGDSEGVAKWVAQELGIDEYFARVLPHEKSEKVKLLQSKGRRVAMVGDGINDAPALTQADLGIAIGAGTNVAIESAGIILVRNDPRDIPKIIRLSRLTYAKMMQNLFWATGYNVVALPLAAGVLASQGILLQPALAALFMSLSTVVVAVNAVLLRRKEL